MQRSISQTTGEAVAKIHWYINLKNLEHFSSIEVIKECLKSIELSDSDAEGVRAVDAFLKALKRREEGKADDDWLRED